MLEDALGVLPSCLHPLILVYVLEPNTFSMFRKSSLDLNRDTDPETGSKSDPESDSETDHEITLVDLYSLQYLSLEDVQNIVREYLREIEDSASIMFGLFELALCAKDPVPLVKWLQPMLSRDNVREVTLVHHALDPQLSIQEFKFVQNVASLTTKGEQGRRKGRRGTHVQSSPFINANFQHLFERACEVGNEDLALFLSQHSYAPWEALCESLERLHIGTRLNLHRVVEYETRCTGYALSKVEKGQVILVFPSANSKDTLFEYMRTFHLSTSHILYEIKNQRLTF
jgi:hypothetical protein